MKENHELDNFLRGVEEFLLTELPVIAFIKKEPTVWADLTDKGKRATNETERN